MTRPARHLWPLLLLCFIGCDDMDGKIVGNKEQAAAAEKANADGYIALPLKLRAQFNSDADRGVIALAWIGEHGEVSRGVFATAGPTDKLYWQEQAK